MTYTDPAVRSKVEWPEGAWMIRCPYCEHFMERPGGSFTYGQVQDTPENHICRPWVQALVAEVEEMRALLARARPPYGWRDDQMDADEWTRRTAAVLGEADHEVE